MPTPHPPSASAPGGPPGEPDESLAARLRGSPDGEVAAVTALLIARHWSPAHTYAVLCLGSSAGVAEMVTAAAFHQVLDRLTLGEPGVALRPRLLLTVRDTVRLWAAEHRISGTLPELNQPGGARALASSPVEPPEHRALAARSFQELAPYFQCLLWHTEVEAEPLAVPAALLGMDAEFATAGLEQAAEKFREGCVRAHRELAPTDECRHYNRLLDISLSRGGALLPDIRKHLAECRYCRNAAEQLSHFEGGLGVLLAEAVLGWEAARYLDSRPGRAQPGNRPRAAARRGRGGSRDGGRRGPGGGAGGGGGGAGAGTGGGRGHGRHHREGLLSRLPVPGRVGDLFRSSRALLTGVGLASAGLLVVGVVVADRSGGGGTGAPVSSTGSLGGRNASSTASATAGSPPATAHLSTAGVTRLRNTGTGLCLAVRGTPTAGAAAELAVCSGARSQQWSYGADGLLRSADGSGLCLDSHADAGVVIVNTCAARGSGRGDDVRYDFTPQGELLARWDGQLALTSTTGVAGGDVVVKVRDGSAGQRWLSDPVPGVPGSLSLAGTGAPPNDRGF
ncbi:RICIN domain-containing protein [Streptomyces mangrovisoli]|uniref:Hydrolase n=1 Tax=Streptomyces mangrovisoli TaxID=1428628 RepID=A0A1J4P2B0_9ACTN|nr:RICIN domain-containing protein [Streptomyces mangrovisoli]OIJ68897.1 hydrolase [Streptomyces mangrovisoli]